MRWLAALGLVVVLIGAALFLVQQPATPGAGGTIEIVMEDLRFMPNRVDVKVGEPVRLRVVNRGRERHDLNFPSLHMPGLQGIETILEPGESRTVDVVFDQAGEHQFICTLPGHAAAGMTGAVFVRP